MASGRKSRRLVLGGLLAALFAASLALNLGAWKVVQALYRRSAIAALDPTSARYFEPRNEALPPKVAERPRVVLLGDSRIAGWRDQAVIPGAEVVNRGRSGDTSAQVRLRVQRDAIAIGADLVVLQVGINDLKVLGIDGDPDRQIEDRAFRNLEATAAALRAAGVPVVLTTVLPVGPISPLRRPFWSDDVLAAVARTNARIRDLSGEGVTVVDLDPVLGDDGRMRSEYAADDFHLTADGYDALGAAIRAAVVPLLSPRALQ